MGVSRLDVFQFSDITANGNPPTPKATFLGPVNGLVTIAAWTNGGSGFSGGTLTAEITHDQVNWVPLPGVSITGNNSQTVNVVAMGIRPKLTGAGAAPVVSSSVAFVEY